MNYKSLILNNLISGQTRKLRRVVEYMMEYRSADIGLVELTVLAELSRAQFFRSFEQSTGITPHRYLTELRLDAAKVLLDQHTL
jgi:AraC family transcriptional regulator